MGVVQQPLGYAPCNGSQVTWPLPNNSALLLQGSDPNFALFATTDWEGNVAKFPYPRTNYLLYSALQSNWALVNATLTAGIADPSGGTGAFTVTATGGSGSCQGFGTVAAGTFCASLWVRRRAGSGIVYLVNPSGSGVGPPLPLSSQWQRFSQSSAVSGTTAYCEVYLVNSGDQVDIAFGQIESGSVPTGYIATTTAAVSVTDCTIPNFVPGQGVPMISTQPSNWSVTFASPPLAGTPPPSWSGQTLDRGN